MSKTIKLSFSREDVKSGKLRYSDTLKRPTTSNADHWSLFLSENPTTYVAVQIAEELGEKDREIARLRAELERQGTAALAEMAVLEERRVAEERINRANDRAIHDRDKRLHELTAARDRYRQERDQEIARLRGALIRIVELSPHIAVGPAIQIARVALAKEDKPGE